MWGCIGAHTKSCVTVARDNHRADYDDDDDDDDDNDEGVNDIDEPQRDAWKCIGTDMKSCVTVARNDHRADYDAPTTTTTMTMESMIRRATICMRHEAQGSSWRGGVLR